MSLPRLQSMSDKITRIIDAAWADLRPDISARIYGSLTAEWDAPDRQRTPP